MESNINIRGYEPQDKSGVVSLLSSFYANMDSERSWERLYMDNPYGRAIISLAQILPEKNIMGHYSVIKMPMTILGRECMGGKGEGEIFDFSAIRYLLSKGRRMIKNISTDLLKHSLEAAVKENLAIVCTNPSDLALKSHIESGYKILRHRLDIFVYVFNRKYMEHLLKEKIRIKAIRRLASCILSWTFLSLYNINVLFHGKPSIRLESIESFIGATDIFTERFSASFRPVSIERKQRHLNWRFGLSDYRKSIVKFNGKPVGYIVLHIFKNTNGFIEANLVDYLFLPESWNIFPSILAEVLKAAKKEGSDFVRINYIYDMKERFHLSDALKRLFFISRPDRRNLVVFLSPALAASEKEMLDINNWFFTDLYFENY